jgi:glycosyltransferase involved in cell wall biosynthesis
MTPFVSVIIATRNRAERLAETLDALARQHWPRDRFQIVVADNGSSDSTAAVVEAACARLDVPSIRYLFVAALGKSSAVNAALAHAHGDLLAFIDDDVLPAPTWIDRLAGAVAETGADFVAGRILPRWEEAPPSWMSPALYGVLAIPDNGERRLAIEAGGSVNIIPIGANLAVRAAVVDRVGGLRTDLGKLEGTLRTGEDHEFFLRMLAAGCRGTYEPTAVVRHWVPAERLKRSYFRRWLHQNGRDVARLEAGYILGIRRFMGAPRHLWRQAAVDALRMIRAVLTIDEKTRVAQVSRLFWFAGYLRESWFGVTAASSDAIRLAEGRGPAMRRRASVAYPGQYETGRPK